MTFLGTDRINAPVLLKPAYQNRRLPERPLPQDGSGTVVFLL